AWLGSFAGDQCYFWIGRRWGLRLLSQRPHWRGPVDSALGWVKRYDTWFILSFRFIYGVRNFSSFALGISGIGWRRFLLLNCLAAMLWALIFVGSGYFCGRALEHMLGRIAHEASVIALAAFVGGAGAKTLPFRPCNDRAAAGIPLKSLSSMTFLGRCATEIDRRRATRHDDDLDSSSVGEQCSNLRRLPSCCSARSPGRRRRLRSANALRISRRIRRCGSRPRSWWSATPAGRRPIRASRAAIGRCWLSISGR